jgi:hypothetical protein
VERIAEGHFPVEGTKNVARATVKAAGKGSTSIQLPLDGELHLVRLGDLGAPMMFRASPSVSRLRMRRSPEGTPYRAKP